MKEARRRHDEGQAAARQLRERCIELEETSTRLQEERAAREQRIGVLEKEVEERAQELAQEAESSTELLRALQTDVKKGEENVAALRAELKKKEESITALQDKLASREALQGELKKEQSMAALQAELKRKEENITTLQAELKKKEESITTLQDKLESTEALNDFLQLNVQNDKGEKSHGGTLARLKEVGDRAVDEATEVSNAVVMLVYSLCETCSAQGINMVLCDQLVRQISHLGTPTNNPKFKDGVMKIVSDAGTLVDGALTTYIQESEQKAKQLEAEKEEAQEAQTAQCESYQKEMDLLKGRLQQLEDMEMSTMRTMISLDAQDSDTMTQNTLTYLRRQNENLIATNQVYLKHIDELSDYVRTALDKTPAALLPKDVRGGAEALQTLKTLQKALDREKGERLLWQTRCEQMEAVLGETMENRSCITDYELSLLSSVVESLFTWVVDHFVTDLDIDIAIEPLEDEYTNSVRQMEGREPLIMEVKLYVIQSIIETASNTLLERRYEMEVAMDAERDRRRELEMELKK